MDDKYTHIAAMFKALGDPNRVMIVEMLSGGELCACKILEALQITQPTLSYHMKFLCGSGLVQSTRVGKWMHYALDGQRFGELRRMLDSVPKSGENTLDRPTGS